MWPRNTTRLASNADLYKRKDSYDLPTFNRKKLEILKKQSKDFTFVNVPESPRLSVASSMSDASKINTLWEDEDVNMV